MTDAFVVIGENIHCSRVVRMGGPRASVAPEGWPGVRFPGPDGEEAWLPLSDAILGSRDFTAGGRVKHVMAAVHAGLAGGSDAQTASAYVAWMARRQIDAGAAYLDLNVDEVDPDLEGRVEAMRWLVRTVGPVSNVPLSIDSSDARVLEAGASAIEPGWAGGVAPMLNSASAERPEVLELARTLGGSVVLSCTGASMPSGMADRLERADEIVGLALAAGVSSEALFVDPLVIPIGVDPTAGTSYLEAVRAIRARYGSDIHITGGVSNVSFGLPARRLVSDAFLGLCVAAGQDSGIVDPVAADIGTALRADRDDPPYRLATAMLTGEDAYGVAFLEAFRAGRVGQPAWRTPSS